MAEKITAPSVERPDLAKHDSSILDLAFAMDCTGSMGSYINTAQKNIRDIVEAIVASENSNVHLALVEYRDHPPQDKSFVTRTHDFTSSVSTMKSWLDNCKASGGGDTPEAVADALHDVLKLSWRDEATKICVLISDAPPHGLSECGDSFPNGCPAGLDPIDITQQLAEKGITLYSVGCEPAILPYRDFFMALAYKTGGQYTPLGGAKLLTKIIIGGAKEEMSLQQWMADVDEEVKSHMASGRDIDDEAMTKVLHSKLKLKGARARQLRRNDEELAGISNKAKAMSEMKHMKSAKSVFKSSIEECDNLMDNADSFDVYDDLEVETTEYQVNRMLQRAKAQNFYKKSS